jgi:hypothetical protein
MHVRKREKCKKRWAHPAAGAKVTSPAHYPSTHLLWLLPLGQTTSVQKQGLRNSSISLWSEVWHNWPEPMLLRQQLVPRPGNGTLDKLASFPGGTVVCSKVFLREGTSCCVSHEIIVIKHHSWRFYSQTFGFLPGLQHQLALTTSR